ncbi:MAG: hypothetical protein M1835_003608 [Candelina submexicana]|nr:MAG: hypothetical protein M1835_003608 [Candelina submexicana]
MVWDSAELQLQQALESSRQDWTTNEGDGAFYGPKTDIIPKDSGGKEHQTATIQLDFQLPQRDELQFTHQYGKAYSKTIQRYYQTVVPSLPVIIHRAIFGSLKRFMALLIEEYNGKWPFWSSPRQVMILTVKSTLEPTIYAKLVKEHLFGGQKLEG